MKSRNDSERNGTIPRPGLRVKSRGACLQERKIFFQQDQETQSRDEREF